MNQSLKGKVAVITGAASGIGRAAARAFGEAGARVSLLTRTAEDHAALRAELPAGSLMAAGDVSDEKTVRNLVHATLENLAGIDVVVNNAGVLTPRAPLTEVTPADWDRSLAVNLRGPFLMMKYALPVLRARGSGLVLNISSGAGRRPAPTWGPYGVAKAGLEALTALAAAENQDVGIAIVSIDPGGTRTKMRAAAYPEEDPETLPTPDEVAAWLVEIAARAGDPSLTGAALSFRDARR